MLAVAGTTGPVTIWDASEGTLEATLPDTSGPIVFSRDGSLIAVRAARQEIALWDAGTGELRRTMQGHSTGALRGLAFSHGGKMLASYGSDSTVLLWDVASGQERRRFSNAQMPLFNPDDAFLAAGATNGDLILWDTRTGETQRTLDDGGYPLAFGTDGATLVSKRLGRAVIWNLASGDEIRTIVEVPELAAVSPDGKWLAGGDDAFGELRLWNLVGDTTRRSVSTAGPVASLAFTGDSSSIVAGTRQHIVQFFDVDSGTDRTPAGPPLGPADLSPDGRHLAVRRGAQIELVDVTTGESRRTLAGNASELESLSFSPDGGMIAGFGGWGFFKTSLRLWDSPDGRELPLAGGSSGTVRTMAFSADSHLLASAGDSRMVTLWDVVRQTAGDSLDVFSDRVAALAFHPDGRRLAVACHDRTLVLWDLKSRSGKTLTTRGETCRQLVFSHDGKSLAGTTDGLVLVWDVEHGKGPAELSTGGGSATSLAFDPAGPALIAGGGEGILWLWNDPAGQKRRDEPDRAIRVGPPHGVVHRVIWSPDGRHVLSVNGNGTIYVLRLAPQK
jgi:WD40 repeat protein